MMAKAMVGSLVRASTRVNGYLAAIVCAVIAAALRLPFQGYLGDRLPYTTVYLAVLTVTRFWGVGPGLLTTVAGWLGVTWITGEKDVARIVVFFAVCTFAIWIIAVLRRVSEKAEESAREAAESLERWREESRQRAVESEQSAQYQAVVESSADAILSKDMNGIIRSWNHGSEQIFGYTAPEVIGQPFSLLVPPDRIHEESDIIERIRHGGRVTHFETIRTRKDGKQIHVSLTISPIRDGAGKVTGISHIARDITERKELETQLRQTQKLESLGVLAGGLAHDFNNLLTGIMGNASLAMTDVAPSDPTHAHLSEILQASERAALLVRQMLAYAGKGQFVVEPLNLSAQVSEIVPLLRTSVSRLVTLELYLDQHLPVVEADRAQIQQLIMNLAINAAEAIGDRPGTVTITTSSRETDAEQQVVLEVKDNGCGMDEETRTRIFDPFFTTKFTGRGLGLAAVMGIIRAHRGTISVESAPGRGSTFTVVLPATVARGTVSVAEPRGDLRGYGLILVVDDEDLVRNMARFTLERCGYTIELAADGRAAVDAFGARPQEFAAVLLDLTMPVMSGEEALGHIQAIRPDVPVVLSSGFSETDAVERFRDRGFAGFLQKPYTATALARKIKSAVRTGARAMG